MRVIVIGAGVVGLATAYFLMRKGTQVIVVDEHAQAGEGTSKGNGAQLCYSYVAPLAGPGVISKLPIWLSDKNSPVRFSPKMDVHQWRWCLQFLAKCNAKSAAATTQTLLALSALSSELMADFVKSVPIDFDYSDKGKLVVYSKKSSFDAAQQQVALQRNQGSQQEVISAGQCIEIEPSLMAIQERIVGAIFTKGDHTADAFLFCQKLAAYLSENFSSSEFRYGETVQKLAIENGKISGVTTANGFIQAEAVVVATGVEANNLLVPVGLRVPIYPVRGYSITVSMKTAAGLPSLSFTDYDRRIVYAPLGKRLRVGGMADIAGYEKIIDQSRVDVLVAEAKAIFGINGNFDDINPWCGLRPATPAGTPIVGMSQIENLFLNVGHGALGWTLSLATGFRVAEEIAARHQASHKSTF
ncbi:D-amino acid dehydrogenase [Glaciimonas sp. PCH181]|uniref:D-amino acid dehydrogenase n=1 Tax=Glaciimonas sp. PCH181 TaxID=2133943 RepID=UPI000D3521D6|nr:D-amino acid dehydrogenase [Glaciimonas sp. PCH181]PUA18689.1 D-amino acid dehydrogenase small subunit [Glaciimonas sp. PCH181]